MPLENNYRSNEVQDILAKTPNWFLRWGISFFFGLLIIILIFSYFIKYPEIISAPVLFTTTTPPVYLKAKSSGLIYFYVENNKEVKSNELLALIENPAEPKSIFRLIEVTQCISKMINSSNLSDLDSCYIEEDLNLGSLQDSYNNFLLSLNQMFRFKHNILYPQKKHELEKKIRSNKLLNKKLHQELRLIQEETTFYEERYQIDSTLQLQNAKTKLEKNESKIALLTYQRSVVTIERSIIQNEISLGDLVLQLNALEADYEEELSKMEFKAIQDFKILQSELSIWRNKYLLESPIDGIISLSFYRRNGQYVEDGNEVLAIVPNSDSYIGYVKLPIIGSGNVRKGQNVIVRLDNYPHYEYGSLKGKINHIAIIPSDDHYILEIMLTNGLITNTGASIPFKQEMRGIAEIITSDKSLIERIFQQFIKLIDKKL